MQQQRGSSTKGPGFHEIAKMGRTCTKAGLSASMAATISADVDRTVSRTATRLPATLTVRLGGCAAAFA
jgi:hypothetical protein